MRRLRPALDQSNPLLEIDAHIEQVHFEALVIGQANEQVALLRQVAQLASAFNQCLVGDLCNFHCGAYAIVYSPTVEGNAPIPVCMKTASNAAAGAASAIEERSCWLHGTPSCGG